MRQSRLYIEQQLASIEDKRKMRSQEEDQALNNRAKAAGWDEEKKIKVQMSLLLKHPSPQLENEVLDTIIKVWELEEKATATSWEKNPALACSVGLDLVKLSQHLDALHARKSVLTIQKIKETR